MGKYKLSEKPNKQYFSSILDDIKEQGFTPINIDISNCYFLFESKEPDTICEFDIKELPKYRFGIWKVTRFNSIKYSMDHGDTTWADYLGIPSYSEFVFFAQYKLTIDKFKPSRSGFRVGLYRQLDEDNICDSDNIKVTETWNTEDLVNVLKYIKHNPIKAYVHCGCQTQNIYEDINYLTCLRMYISDHIDEYKYDLKEKHKLNKGLKKLKHKLHKLSMYDYILIDRGDCWTPRYQLIIRRSTNNYTHKFFKQQNVLNNLDNDKHIFDVTSIDWLDCYIEGELTKDDLQEDVDYRLEFFQLFKNWLSDTDEEGTCKVIEYKIRKNSINFKNKPLQN